MDRPSENIFRMKFIPLALTICFWGFVFGVIISVLLAKVMINALIGMDVILLCIITALVISIFWSIGMIILQPVKISAIGLSGYNFWGIKANTDWNSIIKSRKTNFLGLIFIRIYSKNNRLPIWLPTFLTKCEEFKADVIQFSNNENPLREIIEELV